MIVFGLFVTAVLVVLVILAGVLRNDPDDVLAIAVVAVIFVGTAGSFAAATVTRAGS